MVKRSAETAMAREELHIPINALVRRAPDMFHRSMRNPVMIPEAGMLSTNIVFPTVLVSESQQLANSFARFTGLSFKDDGVDCVLQAQHGIADPVASALSGLECMRFKVMGPLLDAKGEWATENLHLPNGGTTFGLLFGEFNPESFRKIVARLSEAGIKVAKVVVLDDRDATDGKATVENEGIPFDSAINSDELISMIRVARGLPPSAPAPAPA